MKDLSVNLYIHVSTALLVGVWLLFVYCLILYHKEMEELMNFVMFVGYTYFCGVGQDL